MWNCSSHPRNSPLPGRLTESIIVLIWTIIFSSSGCVEVGESWISNFSRCHQKRACGSGADKACYLPLAVGCVWGQGEGGRRNRVCLCLISSSTLSEISDYSREDLDVWFGFFLFFQTVQGAKGTNWTIGSSTWTQGRISSLWGWRSPGPGCPGRLWSLLLWRYSSPAWTRSCAACCRWPCFGRGVGLDDPQSSLPTPNILWFCDHPPFPGAVHCSGMCFW